MSNIPIAPYVVPKNGLDRTIKKNEIINKIVKRVQEFPEFRNYKDDMETLLFICILVEHLVINKKNVKDKIDKRELVADVYEKCFGVNSVNKDVLIKNVQFLYDNKRIKKVSIVQYICGSLSEWFNRKIAWIKENVISYFRDKIINYILKKLGIKKDLTLIFTLISFSDITNVLQVGSVLVGFNKYLLLLVYFLFLV